MCRVYPKLHTKENQNRIGRWSKAIGSVRKRSVFIGFNRFSSVSARYYMFIRFFIVINVCFFVKILSNMFVCVCKCEYFLCMSDLEVYLCVRPEELSYTKKHEYLQAQIPMVWICGVVECLAYYRCYCRMDYRQDDHFRDRYPHQLRYHSICERKNNEWFISFGWENVVLFEKEAVGCYELLDLADLLWTIRVIF